MGLDLKTEYGTDENLERDGARMEIGEGASILVARLGNPAFQAAYQRVPRGIRNLAASGRLPQGKGAELISNLMAKTIVQGWEGLLDNGKPLAYSEDNARDVLIRYKDLRDAVWEFAEDAQNYRDDELEQEAKNFGKSSGTNSPSGKSSEGK